MSLKDLNYTRSSDPLLKRIAFRTLELASGQARFLRRFGREYQDWSANVWGRSPWVWNDALDRIGIERRLHGETWPVSVPDNVPVVMVANHPFGILDGIGFLALAEHLGRPMRILIDVTLLKFDLLARYALPVDFSGTAQARQTNVETRRQARECLARGETILVFPGAGVAIARNPFGPAEDQPWGPLTASLIKASGALTVPVFFEGRCSTLFHVLGRIKLDLRRTLMASEFFRRCGRPLDIHVGNAIPWQELQAYADRDDLMRHLREIVFSLPTRPATA